MLCFSGSTCIVRASVQPLMDRAPKQSSILFDLWHTWMRFTHSLQWGWISGFPGEELASQSVTLYLVSLGLFRLYIILGFCTFTVLREC